MREAGKCNAKNKLGVLCGIKPDSSGYCWHHGGKKKNSRKKGIRRVSSKREVPYYELFGKVLTAWVQKEVRDVLKEKFNEP